MGAKGPLLLQGICASIAAFAGSPDLQGICANRADLVNDEAGGFAKPGFGMTTCGAFGVGGVEFRCCLAGTTVAAIGTAGGVVASGSSACS